jgi:hypothetical protein
LVFVERYLTRLTKAWMIGGWIVVAGEACSELSVTTVELLFELFCVVIPPEGRHHPSHCFR